MYCIWVSKKTLGGVLEKLAFMPRGLTNIVVGRGYRWKIKEWTEITWELYQEQRAGITFLASVGTRINYSSVKNLVIPNLIFVSF